MTNISDFIKAFREELGDNISDEKISFYLNKKLDQIDILSKDVGITDFKGNAILEGESIVKFKYQGKGEIRVYDFVGIFRWSEKYLHYYIEVLNHADSDGKNLNIEYGESLNQYIKNSFEVVDCVTNNKLNYVKYIGM